MPDPWSYSCILCEEAQLKADHNVHIMDMMSAEVSEIIGGSTMPQQVGRIPRDETGTQSIRRAISVLRILATSRDAGLGLTDIARLTGQNHPTTHRILTALIEEGLVERKLATRRYAIGEQIQFLALSRRKPSALMAAAESALSRLAAEIGDTIFLTQRTGLDTICVARCLGSYPIQVASLNVGDRRALGVSSAGLVVLAHLPEAEAQAILALNAPRLAAAHIEVAQVEEMVRAARMRGYAVRDRGIVPGTRAISVPVRDAKGQVFAAITLAGLARRMPSNRLDGLSETLFASATTIEAALAKSAG